MLRLRDAYRERAGAAFRPSRFHDELLAYGGLPVVAGAMGDGPGGVSVERRHARSAMKITVLTYLDSEDENSKEYDPVVPQVARDAAPAGPPRLRPRRPRRRQASSSPASRGASPTWSST